MTIGKVKTMPVPKEFASFFKRLVDKSRKSEINWRATGQPDAFRVDFADFAIDAAQESDKRIRVRVLNDAGVCVADFAVDDDDDDWLGAVGLINSAKRTVLKVDQTMRRAMEELAKEGVVGEGSS